MSTILSCQFHWRINYCWSHYKRLIDNLHTYEHALRMSASLMNTRLVIALAEGSRGILLLNSPKQPKNTVVLHSWPLQPGNSHHFHIHFFQYINHIIQLSFIAISRYLCITGSDQIASSSKFKQILFLMGNPWNHDIHTVAGRAEWKRRRMDWQPWHTLCIFTVGGSPILGVQSYFWTPWSLFLFIKK